MGVIYLALLICLTIKIDKVLYSHGSTKDASVFDVVRLLLKKIVKKVNSVNVTEIENGIKFDFISQPLN